MNKQPVKVCRICGLSLPHVNTVSIAYHDEELQRNADALKRSGRSKTEIRQWIRNTGH